MASSKMNKITSLKDNFSQWYTDIVKNSHLIEYGPVKGTMILKPYGYAIWENMQQILDREFKNNGVDNVYFPLLIPESLFLKEKDHIEGFAPELATVTHIGSKKLDEKLFIRPTSEVIIANYFSKNIKSYRDLPVMLNQWVNVMRWEKTTRPFLRTSEFLWQEGHTLHSTANEARDFSLKILKIYQNFMEKTLMMPVIVGQKTEKEKFAGAQITYSTESLMKDGQALQMGTSHYFGDNFSKVYDIKFQNKSSDWENPFGTSWGVSTRMIGGMIMSHSDDYGLVLPSQIAPIQIIAIPINYDAQVKKVIDKIQKLVDNKYRFKTDCSDKTFGYKISEAEIKGIPLRIEVGLRDLKENCITISRRDLREKNKVNLDDFKLDFIESLMKNYDCNLYDMASKNLSNHTFKAKTIEEYKKIITEKNGFVLVPFCGEISCENDVKDKTATNSRCIPFLSNNKESKCFNCRKKSQLSVYFARSY